ncbi:30S ribosomal protein S13 [Candidatus Woesearchaeota archaeon]|nr:30S ribosomal protein S13 [Candidatus Woesearchaeota archaeon]
MTETKQEIKPFLRVFNTDLDGNKSIARALLKVHGIGFNVANSVCNLLKIDKKKKAGLLSDKEARDIEAVLKENKLPSWMLNNRLDFITGETGHLLGSDLKFNIENTIKRMKKLKLYKGMRHAAGQPVRGQRTRSHFRRGTAVGVKSKTTKVGKAG